MRTTSLLSAVLVACLLTACQSPPSSSGGSSGGANSSSGGSSGSSGGTSGGIPGGGLPGGGIPSGGLPGGGMPGGGIPGTPSGGTPGGGSAGGEVSSGESGGTSGSGAESLEDLDQSLDQSLEEFDETIAGQGSGSIEILNPTGGSSAGIESDQPLFEEGDLGEEPLENSDIEQRASEGSGTGGEGAPGSETIASAGGGSPGEPAEAIPIPEDIGDGQGDDIVLRQIRDAAMKEKDPVLREKLWDEYRRIRGQR